MMGSPGFLRTFINDTHHVSYLVPGNNEFTLDAWETAVLVAVPKKVTMLIDDDIWYHFREDGLCLTAARGHIGDRAGADEKIRRAFVISAHDGMPEMRSSPHLPVQKLRSVIDNRPASGARDMSQSFSNVALQLSIDAVGLLVDAVHIVNSAPASQQGISRALRLMMDASTACMECLSGADTTNTPHLVATREHSMGQTLIENMTLMTRVIADTTQMVKSMCAVNRAISFDD